MITMGKKYKCDGEIVRILCTDAGGKFPVISLFESGVTLYHHADGTAASNANYTLIEVSPYADFKIDEPVMVRDDANDRWTPQHFAGVDTEGLATTWAGGGTSWSKDPEDFCLSWQECRRPTAEELASCAG